MVSHVGDRRCSVDVLAWSAFVRLSPPPRVEDMDDRCCCGTVLIGAVAPWQVYDWKTTVQGGQLLLSLFLRARVRAASTQPRGFLLYHIISCITFFFNVSYIISQAFSKVMPTSSKLPIEPMHRKVRFNELHRTMSNGVFRRPFSSSCSRRVAAISRRETLLAVRGIQD